MENKKINFGLIGCGIISKTHFAAINNLKLGKLTAVCDINKERAQKAGKEQEVFWCTDYRELISRSDVDVVAICTPHNLHKPMAIDCAKAGKHVLVEKPLALSVSEAQEMIDIFKKEGRKLFAVLQVRYNPPIKYLKRLIEEGRLGKINNASLVLRWYRPQAYFENDDWRGRKDMEGGLLFSQGVHYIDIVRWFFGPFKSVYGRALTVSHKIETDDLVVGNVVFVSGVVLNIEMSLCVYPKNLECSLTILGDKGTVKIAGSALNEIEYWEVEGLSKPELPIGFKPNVYANGLYQGSCPNHIYVYEDLIDDLMGVKDFNLKGEEALEAIKLSEAIYKSANSGQVFHYEIF